MCNIQLLFTTVILSKYLPWWNFNEINEKNMRIVFDLILKNIYIFIQQTFVIFFFNVTILNKRFQWFIYNLCDNEVN